MMKNTLAMAIERLDELEPGLRSLDTLFALGAIMTKGEGGYQAGDWDFHIWGHTLGGFSVGAIERRRQNEEPFPMVYHTQRKWIICSSGQLKVASEGRETILNKGEELVIPSMVPHQIYPISKKGIAVLVMVPADPGMQRNG
jgi:mannose-6-phosphate isomerase-like protein (cupin superfamily)